MAHPPRVIPEAAQRLSGTHSAGAWEWVPGLRRTAPRCGAPGTTRVR